MSRRDAAPERPDHDRVAASLYGSLWTILSGWFLVPRDPPSVPTVGVDANTARTRSFRPAPAFLRYLKMWFWIVTIAIDVLLLAAWVAITIQNGWVGLLLLPVVLVLAILPDLVVYVALHLRYDTTWYVMTDRSLRIRRGAWIIREMTFTFDNVQNVRVQQGPIQRLFGIASILVETAGSGGDEKRKGLSVSNLGVIEGVSDAAAIRDTIAERLRRARGTGLGDDDERPRRSAASAWTPAHLAALRDIRADVGRLATIGR